MTTCWLQPLTKFRKSSLVSYRCFQKIFAKFNPERVTTVLLHRKFEKCFLLKTFRLAAYQS